MEMRPEYFDRAVKSLLRHGARRGVKAPMTDCHCLPQTFNIAEPIPGYRIQERIGAGGYGEVWRAEAPGGIAKAIKVVYGYDNDERAPCRSSAR